MALEEQPAEGGGGPGIMESLQAKVGPLPLYAWLGIVTAAALIYVLWYRGKSGAPTAEDQGIERTSSIPSEDVPQFVIQNQLPPISPAITLPPVNVDVDVHSPTAPANAGTTTTPSPIDKKNIAKGAKPAKKYKAVRVAKYTTKNPPWNSTISGIASHYGIKNWMTLWNDPKNAALRKSRKNTPKLIQPGDIVYVPVS